MKEKPSIVFFDMDHTVIAIDCDVSWKYFLVSEGLAPATDCAKADHFLDLYHRGVSDVEKFLQFQLREFKGCTPEEMSELAQRHFDTRVHQAIYPLAKRAVEEFQALGIPVVLLTGTNKIIAEPIAQWLGMSDLLATELEIRDKRFTGKIIEPYLMQEGKVKIAGEYCRINHTSLSQVTCYADSINDVPLFEKAGRSIVINPHDKNLIEMARSRNWCIERWSLK